METKQLVWFLFGRHVLPTWWLLRLPNEACFSHDYSKPGTPMNPVTPIPHRPDFNYTYAVLT